MLHCYVSRAWNADLDRGVGCVRGAAAKAPVAAWEWWEPPPERPLPAARPRALEAADAAAPPSAGAGEPLAHYEATTRRLVAAAKELQEVRRRALELLRALEQQQHAQWLAVNGGNTLSAGLSVAAAVSAFLAPPVGIALGLGSAAVGGAATAGDAVADRLQLRELRARLSAEDGEALAVAELECEWLRARDAAGEALRARGAAAAQLEEAGALGAAAAGLGAAVARAVLGAAEGGGGGAAAGLAQAARAGTRVLGVASAVLSTGLAVHGWATTKPLQASVRERAGALEASLLHTQRWLSGVGELECSICLCAVGLSEGARRCRTWHYSHARCHQRWEETCREAGRAPACPLCTGAMAPERRTLEEFLTEDIRSNLREGKA